MDKKKKYPFIVFISAVVFFIPFLGHAHLFDWDEVNFAEAAREMLVTGNYSRVQIDFQPFYEKPPLFIWLQAASMIIFGVNEFAARFPDAIVGVITLLTFYFIGKKLRDETFGLLWSLAYLGSILPFLYFKSGIIDPVFNYFIFLAVFFVASSIRADDKKKSSKHAIIAGVATGLGMLTKGPVALLVLGLTVFVYWATIRFRKLTSFLNIVLFAIACFSVAFLWFGYDMIQHGSSFIKEFVNYQIALLTSPVAGHGEPFYYYFVIVFFGCFSISILALPRLFKFKTNQPNNESTNKLTFQKWMLILFWVVMILFTLVKSKIVHYTSLAYFPLSFLAATFIYDSIKEKARLPKYLTVLLVSIGSLLSLVFIAVPLIAQHKEIIIPYIKDPFAVACLNTDVYWNGCEYLIGVAYLDAIIYSVVILRKNIFRGTIVLFYSTAIFLLFYLITVVPKIENYSQGPAINFYKELAGKDVYVNTVDFKSYAQYFYFQKMPSKPEASDNGWLLNGPIDKPAYFVAKVTSKDFFDDKPQCKLIRQEGGFLFYSRQPEKR
jgi:hypothetical protein